MLTGFQRKGTLVILSLTNCVLNLTQSILTGKRVIPDIILNFVSNNLYVDNKAQVSIYVAFAF